MRWLWEKENGKRIKEKFQVAIDHIYVQLHDR